MSAGVSGARLGREPQEGLHTDLPLTVARASGGSDVGGPLAWARLRQGAGRGGFGGPRCCCRHNRQAGKLVRWLAVGLQQTDFMSVCFCNTFL